MFCYLWVLSAWKELDCHQQKTFPPTSATLQAFQDSACLEPFFEIQEEDVTPPRRVLLTTCMLQVSGFWFIIIAWHPEVSEESSPAMSINCTGRNQSCQKSGVEMGWSFVDRACFSALCGKGTNTSGEPRCSSVRKD